MKMKLMMRGSKACCPRAECMLKRCALGGGELLLARVSGLFHLSVSHIPPHGNLHSHADSYHSYLLTMFKRQSNRWRGSMLGEGCEYGAVFYTGRNGACLYM